MQVETIVVGQLDTNCFVSFDHETREAIIIDPGDEPDKIIEYVKISELRPTHIIFTHAHYDHVCAVKELKDTYRAKVVMHESEAQTYGGTIKRCVSWGYAKDAFPSPDIMAKEGDKVLVGKACFRVIHTPGHTPGGICLYGENLLFSGDTLFRGSVGRTDLPGGSMEDLRHSLKKLILLDPLTRVLCGHEEETTIGREIRSNPFLQFP